MDYTYIAVVTDNNRQPRAHNSNRPRSYPRVSSNSRLPIVMIPLSTAALSERVQ